MGATSQLLLTMILVQVGLCAFLGTGFGLGICAVVGQLASGSDYPFRMMWFTTIVGGHRPLIFDGETLARRGSSAIILLALSRREGPTMPLVFVHGVNTRNTDEDYTRSVAARKTMFEQIVVPAVVKRGFPDFSVAEDIYWGDLGVGFAWNLRSVPPTKLLQSLGAVTEAAPNLDLLELVLAPKPASSGVQSLGVAQPLVAASKANAGALVRAIFAPEADRFAPREMSAGTEGLSPSDAEKAASQGEHLGLMLIAAELFAAAAEAKPELVTGTTDSEVLDKIQNGVVDRYRELVEQRNSLVSTGQIQHLGQGGNPIGWVTDHLASLIDAAKSAASSAIAETQRAASLVALKEVRDGLSRRALRFLGDAFVYLHHGKTRNPAIFDRVKKGLLALDGRKNQHNEREPYILVSHSFGSEIVYDLLSSGTLSDLTIDLWVTAGAQTSLFAEMLLFDKLPNLPSDMSNFVLGRPSGVMKWINFYDAADVLSYLHEPIFGKRAVTDIPVRAQANVTNAHGHYFVDPSFYQRIAAEI
jgi:hypothetical protein